MRIATFSPVATFTTLAAVVVLAAGCGSGGSDPANGSSGGTSSGGSSSGVTSGGTTSSSGASGTSPPPSGCEAICSTHAEVVFEESNADGRLEGSLVEACHLSDCARGTLSKRDGGAGYTLSLKRTSDAGSGAYPVDASVGAGAAPSTLRFRVRWTLGEGTGSGSKAVDGDTFTVSARTSEDGPELFARSFTATYRDAFECGTACRVFEAGP